MRVSNFPFPIPFTFRRFSGPSKGPQESRWATMASARAGPTPGRRRSWAAEAELTSIRSPGASGGSLSPFALLVAFSAVFGGFSGGAVVGFGRGEGRFGGGGGGRIGVRGKLLPGDRAFRRGEDGPGDPSEEEQQEDGQEQFSFGGVHPFAARSRSTAATSSGRSTESEGRSVFAMRTGTRGKHLSCSSRLDVSSGELVEFINKSNLILS